MAKKKPKPLKPRTPIGPADHKVIYHVLATGEIRICEIARRFREGYGITMVWSDPDPDDPSPLTIIRGLEWHELNGPTYFLDEAAAESRAAEIRSGKA